MVNMTTNARKRKKAPLQMRRKMTRAFWPQRI
jgi:hypothetical protein